MNESWNRFKIEGHADVHDANVDADMTREHIDASAPAQEVQDHLRSNRRGIGAHPFHRHAMIGCKGKDRSTRDLRLHLTRDHDVARGQFLESAQAADRLRQSVQARLRLCQETRIGRLNPVNGFVRHHPRHSSYFNRSGRPLIVT